MSAHALTFAAALLGAVAGLSAAPAAADEMSAQLAKFVGCWVSEKAFGTMLTTDAFKPDGYELEEEVVAVKIEPVEGEAFTSLVKGTLDIWSEKGDYYIPTIYYGGVYDPIRDAILTDSTFYVVGDRLYFVHYRTTERRADRAFRILDRVDCSVLQAKRDEAQRTYKPAPEK
ncbi:MAG: hypothetical protein R3D30_12860 [Hyphomicrobiales bacterium]